MHIVGSWNTKDFFKFLVKFGVQKTNPHNQKESHGYIFGNITSRSNVTHPAAFAVLDRGYFLEYYGNRSVANKEKACARMFNKVSTMAFDEKCFDQGEDFLRKVPCPEGQLCVDEDIPWNVIKHHQFTFIIEDLKQPRFWYISMVACYRDSSCQWHHLDEEMDIDYDIWLVNGSPNISGYNPFLYQFSVDRQKGDRNGWSGLKEAKSVEYLERVIEARGGSREDLVRLGGKVEVVATGCIRDDMLATRCVRDDMLATRCVRDDILAMGCVRDNMLATRCVRDNMLATRCVRDDMLATRCDTAELYLVFFLCYVVLVPLQLYAATRQKHPVTRLFTASLLLEFLALCFILIHVLKFAFDGVGVGGMAVAGDILDILSRIPGVIVFHAPCCRRSFMLLLLLLAKGWAVTRMELTYKPLVFAIWFLYGVVHILLYVWNMKERESEALFPQTEVDIVDDIDEYQTWPGWLIIVFRTLIMVWFLYELRNTMMYEHNTQKLNFFLHFGASALVWFIYLPIIALIALQVSALWRFKLLLGKRALIQPLTWYLGSSTLMSALEHRYNILGRLAALMSALEHRYNILGRLSALMSALVLHKYNILGRLSALMSALILHKYNILGRLAALMSALVPTQVQHTWQTICAHECLGSHTGITYSADCLAYCVMTHLLWPARSEQYFLLAEEADLGDELDEFNEAPHVINNYTRLSEPPDLGKIIA
uniref:GPR180/TMEM145 transmembrane domain-containing protein n=1 Tax=Timema shepardi TaxID=629360 RepID=A0A7R9FYV9_TIMSH|nr:unnamed protein product [Timema shepardi]